MEKNIFDGIPGLDDEPQYKKSPVNTEYENPDGDFDDGYENLDDKKKKEEIRKLQIFNEKELNNLVSRDLILAILSEVGHQIQTNFVDLARRESPNLAAELGISNLERDLEKKLSDLIMIGIESCQNNITRLSQDGIFE